MQTTAVDRQYWNIVKGIGIILVVLGHMATPATKYIYLFHMPLFFFVNGYLYNEEKYGDEPYLHIAAKLKRNWPKYIILYFILILLHNTLYVNGILERAATEYSVRDIFIQMSRTIFGAGTEFLAGPVWFVPVSVIASCILGFIVTYSRRISKRFNNNIIKYSVQFLLILMCTLIGYVLMSKYVDLYAHMQISLVIMPCLWCGYLLRNLKIDMKRLLNPIIAIVCGVLVYVASLHFELELVMFMKIYPYMHIVAMFGIYMCLYFAKISMKIPIINKILDLSGEASFFIMATHFGIFRLFDWAMAQKFYPEDPRAKYLELPNSFTEILPVYFIIGYLLPLLVYFGWKKIKEKLHRG